MESKKAKKNPSSRNPPGDFSAKMKVEEMHHASLLVGSIMEKGFSSSSIKPQQKPSLASYPQPTVLPFPVARHRSHGPHWAPVGAGAGVGEHGDEVDRDDTDYDPISSSAHPLQRKGKKGLDLSRWRELLQEESAAASQLKQKEERKTTIKNLLTAASTGSDVIFPEDTAKELLHRSSSMELDTRADAKTVPSIVGREELDLDGLGSQSIIADSKTVPSDFGVEEFGPDGMGSQSLMDDIDAENLARLKQMSPDEIAEAQAEITEKMDSGILEMLRKRARDKSGNKKVTGLERDKGRRELGSGPRVEGGMSSTTGVGAMDSLLSGVGSSISWSVWSERVEKARALRFSLEGDVVDIEPRQSIGGMPDRCQYDAEKVAERDFLRTEGDPAAVGYTIKEAVALIRSMFPGQRALALQLLACVLTKALHNLQKKDTKYNVEKINSINKFVDWQAVWAFALGPEPQMAFSLRIALDDNHDSVVLASAKAIQYILCCDINDHFFNISEKLSTHEKGICTAPVFRHRPEVGGGFLHGGFWKYNTKSSNILPFNDKNEDDQSEGKHTIQDDVVVAGQDVAAGLIRMGILPRICYLLEMDPIPTLEECLVSILIALARHSSACANAIMKCPRLVQTVVKMLTKQGTVEIHHSQIKAVILLKVLSRSDKQICLDFVKRGIFRDAMWHLYKHPFSLEHWIQSGREHCKLNSSLMVEQLRFWKVCIRYGCCIEYFTDFFPAMCLWLSPPTFEKLIKNNVLGEFASITREAYLVLEALAQRLPSLHSMEQLNKQAMEYSDGCMDAWSWSHAGPMVDLALKWLSLKSIPYVSSVIGCQKGSINCVQDSSVSCMIWVISAIVHMICSILDRIASEDIDGSIHLPWLPYFVPKVGLEIVKNGLLNFLDSSEMGHEGFPNEGGSLAEGLCQLRHHSDFEVSLSSVSCLHGLVRLAFSVDKSVQRARGANLTQPLEGYRSGIAGRILEEGIVKWAQNDLVTVLNVFMTLVSSEFHVVQSVEMFGRGGPTPGIGVGWGASGGGFWSSSVLLAQVDAQLILSLLKVFPIVLEKDLALVQDMKPVIDGTASAMTLTLQRINSVLGVCLVAGPGDRVTLEKALDILLQPPVLKYLSFCIRQLLLLKGFKSFNWQHNEDDYMLFSKILSSHFRNRWLGIKRKSSGEVDKSNHSPDISRKSDALETIPEDLEISEKAVVYPHCNSLLIEWAHQRLPLPLHWFLSPISSMGDNKSAHCSPSARNIKNSCTGSSNDVVDVTRSGLFLLLCLEAIPSFLCSASQDSPIQGVPLVWKLHALSMALLVSMDILEEEKSRDVFETLQELYGQRLNQSRRRNIEALPDKNENFSIASANLLETQENNSLEFLNFQTQVHESYTTFLETLIEQFAAISYGDVIYGRQVALYLHRSVEAAVRLAAWNTLSNAHVLELLPPLENCFAGAEGYLEPVEDNEGILEAYAKSWISGSLNRAAARGSVSFTLALHQLSCFIFHTSDSNKFSLRNKLAKFLLRGYSRNRNQEAMLLDFVRYRLPNSQGPLHRNEIERRIELLKEACEDNSSLLAEVEKLQSSM